MPITDDAKDFNNETFYLWIKIRVNKQLFKHFVVSKKWFKDTNFR